MNISKSRYGSCMYFSANALARKMEKLANESWKKVNLSASHAYMLMIVIQEPGVQPGALAQEMQLTPSTITRLIEKLEEKKLLVRTTEGKITNVYPTPKAKQLHPRFKECVEDYCRAYAEFLSENDSLKLLKAMHKLTDKLPG